MLILKTVHDIASCPYRDLIPTSPDILNLLKPDFWNPLMTKQGKLMLASVSIGAVISN